VWEDGRLADGKARSVAVEIAPPTGDLLEASLEPFTALTGDRRTAALVAATVRGIVASESLICSRIAAFSPSAGRGTA
jgi:hypothetical protein